MDWEEKRVVMKKVFYLCVMMSFLSGCQKMRDIFGVERNAPNEFACTELPPLSMPPHFDVLPQPGHAKETEREQAEKAIFGYKRAAGKVSKAEKHFLKKTGKVDPKIREKIDAENPLQKKTALQKILPYKEGKSDTLDVEKEKKRLKKAHISTQ